METTIELLVDNSPATVAEIISGLKSLGVQVKKYAKDDADHNHSRLSLTVNTGKMSTDELYRHLLKMEGGPIEVLNSESSALSRPVDAQASDNTETASVDTDDPQIDSSIVEEFINEFPMIMGQLDTVERMFGPTEQVPYFKRLGEEVGKGISGDEPKLATAKTVNEALKLGVLPLLDTIVEGEVAGNDLKIQKSIFTRSNLKWAGEGGKSLQCNFLVGLIQGLINDSAKLSGVSVTELQCIDRGDSHCLFKVDAN